MIDQLLNHRQAQLSRIEENKIVEVKRGRKQGSKRIISDDDSSPDADRAIRDKNGAYPDY